MLRRDSAFKRLQFRITRIRTAEGAMTATETTTPLQFPTREECAVPDLLAARAEAVPDKPFLLFEEETWSYRDAAREAWRAGNALIDQGVKSGDYVSVWMPTGPDV